MPPSLDQRRAALGLDALRAASAQACGLLKVLANPDRLLLMCALAQGECCVSALEERLDIRQPTLSQQLGVLRAHGLVMTRREGKNIHYAIASDAALAVMAVLHEQFCAPSSEGTTG